MMSNNQLTSYYNDICAVENFILSGKFTLAILSKNLQQLKQLRKSFYNNLIENSTSSDYKKFLFDEYKNYCNFNVKLINSKKFANAIYFRLLHEFLNDYNIIKPYDSEKFGYKLTLSTLANLSTTLKNTTNPMKKYRQRGIIHLINQFINENNTTETKVI